jgi:hypothetical protein
MSNPRPGWYSDPADATHVRWWDGNSWTGHVQPRPQELTPEPAMAAATVATTAPAVSAWPVADPAATQWPVDAQPAAALPVDDQPATAWQPVENHAATQWPVDAQPGAALPVDDQPATAWPATETTWEAADAVTAPPIAPSPEPAPALAHAPAETPAPSAFPSSFTTGTDMPAVVPPPAPNGAAPLTFAPDPFDETAKKSKQKKPKKDKKPKTERTRSRPLVQESGSDSPRMRRLLLIGGVLVAALMVGAAVTSTGVLDTSSASSEPSDPSVRVFEGNGYSVEIPRDWEQAADPGPNVDVRFLAPEGVELSIGHSAPEAIPKDENALSQLVVDTIVQTQLTAFPGSSVLSREAAELGGTASDRLTIAGTAFGAPVRAIEDGVIHDGQIWIVGMTGTPEAVAAALPVYEKVVTSFSFA